MCDQSGSGGGAERVKASVYFQWWVSSIGTCQSTW
jgi:hypothetical protein